MTRIMGIYSQILPLFFFPFMLILNKKIEWNQVLAKLQGLAMVMHKNNEGSAVFEMLYKALGLARHENRVTEERNIKILIAQMHVVKVIFHFFLSLLQ